MRAFDQRDLDQSGFLLKSVAVALSCFQVRGEERDPVTSSWSILLLLW